MSEKDYFMLDDLLKHDDLGQAFHNWKHENIITKIIFKYLKSVSDECTQVVVNNAFSHSSPDEKLMIYHICAAKIQLINEILNLSLEDFK